MATIAIVGLVIVAMWLIAGAFSRRDHTLHEHDAQAEREAYAATQAARTAMPVVLLGGTDSVGTGYDLGGGDAGGGDGGGA